VKKDFSNYSLTIMNPCIFTKKSICQKKHDFRLLVLAGGFGRRLNSVLHNEIPKPLAPIGETPFLKFLLENWISQGVRSFVFLLHHQASLIQEFLDKLKANILKDCEVVSLVEPIPMDTGGAVAFAVSELGLSGDFLVANADTWTSTGINELVEASANSLVVTKVDDSSRFGLVEFDKNYRISHFVEKNNSKIPGWINVGLYKLQADIFKNWDGTRFSLEQRLFVDLVQCGKMRAVTIETDFIDIGIPSDYQRFCYWIENGRKDALCN
jgi:D-glycero-alpha-D-manno-heptose 1-phosphate guanylyltransferase